MSLSILEAMSYGRCCLVSDIPENLEAIGDTGFSFKSGNVDSLKKKLDWLLRHPEEAEAMGSRGKHRVGGHYSWDSVTEQMENFYSRISLAGHIQDESEMIDSIRTQAQSDAESSIPP